MVLGARDLYWSHSFPYSLKDAVFVAAKGMLHGGAVLRIQFGDWRTSRIAYSRLRDAVVGA